MENLKALDRYPCCGHSALMGNVAREWEKAAYVLALFGVYQSSARRQYRKYVEKDIAIGKRVRNCPAVV